MIPVPQILRNQLTIGNKEQLKTLHAYTRIKEEENLALLRKTGIRVNFKLENKAMFNAVFRNINIATKMVILIHEAADPVWEYDDVIYEKARREPDV